MRTFAGRRQDQRGRSAWAVAAAIGVAVAVLAGCSSGGGQRQVAVPHPGAATEAAATAASGPSPSGHAAKGRRIGSPAPSVRSKSAAGGHLGGSLVPAAGSGSGKTSAPLGAAARPLAKGRTVLRTQGLVARLPRPTVRSGPSISFSDPVFMGSSILGDLGSAAWNVTHRDADGQLRTWGSGMYMSSTGSNALAVLRKSPAVKHYCPKGSSPLAGFSQAGSVTVAVVCPDPTSKGVWWTVFERADHFTYLVLATSDSTRPETIATGGAAFRALTAMTSRVNIGVAQSKTTPEPTG